MNHLSKSDSDRFGRLGTLKVGRTDGENESTIYHAKVIYRTGYMLVLAAVIAVSSEICCYYCYYYFFVARSIPKFFKRERGAPLIFSAHNQYGALTP